ncbi:caspase-7-like [Rana temporaria]|uniref:caspase-7-like n=1 Tax=Rana temporaria TaxID=8407 RepID=UPI001AAE0E4B|nr:caspase-7-like [Rana temporaria]XP_040201998.1 caspase-7-like [Rana temporaria]XP_040201999.1 caspase-7-like [Rana temporaria]
MIKPRALIISMTEFHSRPGGKGMTLDPRKGAMRDTNRLFQILSRLGFEVTLSIDASAREIREIYRKEREIPQGDCFINIISSHGEEGVIYDFHGEQVYLRDLYDLLSPENCPALAGVPKLFFIQACRGMALDQGVFLETDGAPPQISAFSHIDFIPRDTVVVFASSEGYAAFQNPLGSIFLQTLCNMLDGKEKDLEITQLLTRLNHLVAYNFESRGTYGGYKEMPCFITNLTRDLHPFKKRE